MFLTELHYFGPIRHYALIASYGGVELEQHENFVKSTYRNRCCVSGPNGKLRLSIPLKGGKDKRRQTRRALIDNSYNWKRIHWESLCACYRRSPYFEFYEDDFLPFFEREDNELWTFNLELMQKVLELIGMDVPVSFSAAYNESPSIPDYRNAIRPNKPGPDDGYEPQAYEQVFSGRNGFIPELTILDALFSLGPNTMELLNASYATKR